MCIGDRPIISSDTLSIIIIACVALNCVNSVGSHIIIIIIIIG
jgi:hypothetical protein